MPRGDLVGDAYVRIHADTSAMRRELRKQAKGDADSYMKEFDKEVQSTVDRKFASTRKKLAEALVSEDFSAFEKEFGSVEQAYRRVRSELRSLERQQQITKKDADAVRAALEKWKIPAKAAESKRAIAALNAELEKQVKLGEQLSVTFEKAEFSRITKDWESFTRAIHKSNPEWERNRALIQRSEGELKRVAVRLRESEQLFGKMGRGLRGWATAADKVGDSVGSIFGKGGRNDFVNAIGSTIGGITKLVLSLGGIPQLFGKVSDGLEFLTDQFKSTKAVDGMGAAISELGGTLLKAGLPGLAAFAIALTAIIGSLGIAAAAVSTLAGAVLALASALAFALAGGILPMIPALASLAPAIQVVLDLLGRFKGMSEKGWDKLHPELAKLRDSWLEVKDAVSAAGDGVEKSIAKFAPLLTSFWKPLVVATAKAMADISSDLANQLNSPGMKKFLNQWKKTLPEVFRSLGLGINNLLAGFIKFFTPILPFAQKLADNFSDLMSKFSEWAGSAKGQNQIKDFMEKAWAAAGKLWDIIKNIGVTIGLVFGSGEETGKGFLDSLNESIDRLNGWLQSTEGQTALSDFFTNAKDAVERFGHVLDGLGKTFDSLDTEETRGQLLDIISALATIAGWVNALASIPTTFDLIRGAVVGLGKALVWMVGAAQDLWLNLRLGFLGIQLVAVKAFGGLVDFALGALQKLLEGAAKAFGWVPGVGDKLRTAAGNVAKFRESTNSELGKITKSIEIDLETAQAEADAKQLKKSLDQLNSKTITVGVRYVTSGPQPGGGRSTAGGQTGDAAGAIHAGPTRVLLGEAGPEAVVPLNRPLSMVDPAVRQLSAFAQGLPFKGGGVAGGGRTINVAEGAIKVTTSATDPTHVAMSVLDRLTAAAF